MSPNNFNSWNANADEFVFYQAGEWNGWGVNDTTPGVREILIKSLKLIKVYFREIKNKISPWIIPKNKKQMFKNLILNYYYFKRF